VKGVLFIVGSSRSGSTLLERLLNELPSVVSVGELSRVWQRGFIENQFHDCPFWREVVQRAFADGEVDARANAALSRSVYRGGMRPESLPASKQQSFLALWGRQLSAIADTAGARWVVDSSKIPAYAAQLALLPGLDTRYLHLVRDARAVAHSKSRLRQRPQIYWRESYMSRRSAWASAGGWNDTQRLVEVARQITDRPWLRLRYEELAAEPRVAVGQVWDWLGLAASGGDADPLGFIGDGSARVGSGHSVSGNPMRFSSGDLRITPDIEWRQYMSQWNRAVVSVRSYLGLRRYGYL
jgi:LPS sulfotransferase NodH